jgi:hypothetical protein
MGEAVGARKKILRLSHNFVLAWTGHLIAARSVINSIRSSLDLNAVTFDAVKAILVNPATSNLGLGLEVILVCWIIDGDGIHCFLWNSRYPHELFSGSPQYAGSGEDTIRALVGPRGVVFPSGSPGEDFPQLSTVCALGIVGQLLRNEMQGRSTWQLGFGFAYEVLMWKDGVRFEYLDNILYLTLKCVLDKNSKFLGRDFGDKFYKYESDGNRTKVFVYDTKTRHQDIHLITAPGDDNEEEHWAYLHNAVRESGYRYPFKSDFYIVVIEFKSPEFTYSNFVRIVPQNDPEFIFDVSTSGSKSLLDLRFQPATIESMYRYIKENVIRSSSQPKD